jgi:type IV pilus assembly protein PilC
MPIFIYKARDPLGKPVQGRMEAKSKEELVNKLHRMGYITTKVVEIPKGFKLDFRTPRRINPQDIVMFNLQLSNMINAGINILRGLDIIGKQIENRKFKEVVEDVKRNVEAGESFSQALSKYPKVFPHIFVSMVKAGEASGRLDIILKRYSDFFEYQLSLKQKIKGILFYPLILLFAGIVVTLFMVSFVVPRFAEIFLKIGMKLPLPTLVLYKIGMIIKNFWLIIILSVVSLWIGLKYYVSSNKGKIYLDKFKLKLPLFGPLYRKISISRFTRTFSTLLKSGVPILESLEIVKDVVGNELLKRTLENVKHSLEKGEKISDSLKVSEEFPLDVIQMISVGEEAGNLDEMLNKISDFYDLSWNYTIKKLTSLIEPFLLVLMGGLVGFIMASLLLPIFDMIKMLRH